MVRPPRGGGGIPPRSAHAEPSLSLRRGVSSRPLTRARVRLLGPCFKTGRVGYRHRRGPLAPALERDSHRLGGGARSGRTEHSPPQSTATPGARGARPPARAATGVARAREKARRKSLPRPLREAARLLPGGCNTRGRSLEPPSPRPSQPTRSRSRRTASGGNAPGGSRARAGGGPLAWR